MLLLIIGTYDKRLSRHLYSHMPHACIYAYIARRKEGKKETNSLVTGLNFQGCLFTRIDLHLTIVSSTLLGHLDEQIEAGVIEATKASNIDNPTRG